MSVLEVRCSREPVLADLVGRTAAANAVLVLAAAGLVGLSAQLVLPVPGTPVPVTAQTFTVLVAGAALGWRRAAASLVLYLVAGVAGVPWFAGHGAGWGGPTFGYVLGFLAAGCLVGAMAARGVDRSPPRLLMALLAGTVAIYAVGVPWLMASLQLGLADGLRLGFLPFLPGDVLKATLAAGVLPVAWRLLGSRAIG